MKILLVGEYSGAHNNLKKGLNKIGHEVKLAGDGDGFKKFHSDFKISISKNRLFGPLINLIYLVFNIHKFTGYDIVQFVNPYCIPYYYHLFLFNFIVFNFNKKAYLYACGTDDAYLNSREELDYHPLEKELDKEPISNSIKEAHYNYVINKVDGIIPASFSYYVGYRDNKKIKNNIPLAGGGEYIDTIKKVSKENINILFGITRREFKGADLIEEALSIVSKENEKINIKIVEKLPFNEYIKYLEGTDILIDQCKSYAYGMNAIFALEKGVIVLSGAEPIAMKYANFNECPVINIRPEVNDIVNKILLITRMTELELNKIKIKSLTHVKKYHSPTICANKFINIWAGYNNINS